MLHVIEGGPGEQFPGRERRTPIPKVLKRAAQTENLDVLQSYKGFALLECRHCEHFFVAGIHKLADWSCPACDRRKFYRSQGYVTKVGKKVHGRPHTRLDRDLSNDACGDQLGVPAA